jgi:hypothetical protein
MIKLAIEIVPYKLIIYQYFINHNDEKLAIILKKLYYLLNES